MEPVCVVSENHISKVIAFSQIQNEWDGKWDKGIMYYDIDWHESLKLINVKELQRAVNLAMTTWDFEIPVKFHPSDWWNTKEPDIRITFRTPDQDKYFADRPSVLAYAYMPGQGQVSGEVVFNAGYIWDLQGKGIKGSDAIKKGLVENVSNPNNILRTYNINAVLIHELGHALGLTHDISGANDGSDVMDAYYKADNLDLSDRDIIRIRQKYGERLFKKSSHYTILKRWLKRRIRRL